MESIFNYLVEFYYILSDGKTWGGLVRESIYKFLVYSYIALFIVLSLCVCRPLLGDVLNFEEELALSSVAFNL